MDPLAPPQTPNINDPETIRRIMSLSTMPEQERMLLERLGYGRSLFTQKAHQGYGLGGGIAWGLADAVSKVMGGLEMRDARRGLEDISKQRTDQRNAFFSLDQDPAQDPGVPEMLRRPGDENPVDRLRRRGKMAEIAAATGDPALQAASQSMMKESEMEREYAALAEEVRHRKFSEGQEERKTKVSEREMGLKERTAPEWVTSYAEQVGGFIHSSKHTGEAWLIIPGSPPVKISEGGQPNGPQVAATAPGGATPPYVKLNEHQSQAAVRGQAGATGLADALDAGFPSTNTLGGTAQALRWKAAEHGWPQATPPNDQARVAAWDAVFDPVARMRAGLRIPEEQMSRMRMELRPNPSESWDNQIKKVRRLIETFRAEAQTLPPVKSKPILDELDLVEGRLPTTKQQFEEFNKGVVKKMEATRKGAGDPLRRRSGETFLKNNLAPPPAAPQVPLGSHDSPVGARVDSYYR